MKTRNLILLLAGLFICFNVTLGWVSFFIFQQTPGTLLTLCLSVGGIEGVLTAVVAIAKSVPEKKKKGKSK